MTSTERSFERGFIEGALLYLKDFRNETAEEIIEQFEAFDPREKCCFVDYLSLELGWRAYRHTRQS